MELNTTGLSIQKANPTATDGYDGGLQVIRDTSSAVGGKRGMVNCGLLARTVAGKDVKNFEWNGLFLLDNHSDEGENVALYAQGNKHGAGPTWGACVEACDVTENPSGTVGIEVDCWVTGADTGNRIGADIVVGDAKLARAGSVSAAAEASVGVRICTSNAAPHAKWNTGLQLLGNIGTGIDCSSSTATTALKLNKDQKIVIGGTEIGEKGMTVKPHVLTYVALVVSIVAIVLQFIR